MPPAPRTVSERRWLAHVFMASVVLLAGVAAIILYRFSPAGYGFYPVCPVHAYLHLECPGCGTTRALAALVHGHLAEALRLNALTIGFALPIAVVYGVLTYVRVMRGEEFRWPQLPTPAVYAGAGVMLAFTVLRNL